MRASTKAERMSEGVRVELRSNWLSPDGEGSSQGYDDYQLLIFWTVSVCACSSDITSSSPCERSFLVVDNILLSALCHRSPCGLIPSRSPKTCTRSQSRLSPSHRSSRRHSRSFIRRWIRMGTCIAHCTPVIVTHQPSEARTTYP